METNPTDLPDLSKPFFSRSNRGKTQVYKPKFGEQSEKTLFIPSNGGFATVPGSEPIHLDLEKLFLLSVSKESLDVRGNFRKFEFRILVPFFPFVLSVSMF